MSRGDVDAKILQFRAAHGGEPSPSGPVSGGPPATYQDLVRLAILTVHMAMWEGNVSPATRLKALTIVLTGNPGEIPARLAEADIYQQDGPDVKLLKEAVYGLFEIMLDDETNMATRVRAADLVLTGSPGAMLNRLAENRAFKNGQAS